LRREFENQRRSAFPAKLREVKRRAKDEDAANNSMDVRQKQRLFKTVFGFFQLARSRFLPTSSQPLGGTLEIERRFKANKLLIVSYNSTFRRLSNIAKENLYL